MLEWNTGCEIMFVMLEFHLLHSAEQPVLQWVPAFSVCFSVLTSP